MVDTIIENLGWERVCWQAERYKGKEVGYYTYQCVTNLAWVMNIVEGRTLWNK